MKPTIKPLPRQDLAWQALKDQIHKYIVFGGGAGGGKTWLGCEWLMTNCYFYPGSKWFVGRNELKRLMASSYETFKKVCKFHKIPEDDWKMNGQYNFIEFANKSRIDLLDLKEMPADPLFERFGSLEYTGGWIEEAGEVKFKAFDVLKSRIGRHMNKELGLHPKLLSTCNPKKNWLKRVVYKPHIEGTLDPKYIFIESLYKDNHYTSDIYGENLSEISDKATRQRLKEGKWDYDEDEGTLVDYDAIIDLWTTKGKDTGVKYLTADIARFGKDRTVIHLWKGLHSYKRIELFHQDTQMVADEIITLLKEHGIDRRNAVIDEVGVGGGVLDKVRGANGFIANASPMDVKGSPTSYAIKNGVRVAVTQRENFKTLKDQCGYRMADRVNNREVGITITDEKVKEMIEEEMGELKDAKPDEDVKKRLIPKDEIKETLGRSPDDLDAIVMREYFELVGVKKITKRPPIMRTATSFN